MARKHKIELTESVKIDKRLMYNLRIISKESGMSLTWMLNKAVSEWIASYESR